MWFGKLIGAFFGYLLAGPLGLVLGFLVGSTFDRGYRLHASSGSFGHQRDIQECFFRNTFTVMGHIAKADGRVSEREIATAKGVMTRLNLSAQQRQFAIEYFNQGKASDFDIEAALREIQEKLTGQRMLLHFFIEIQCQVALADGVMTPKKQALLAKISQRLDVEPLYQRFERVFGGGFHQQGRQHRPFEQPAPRIQDDYQLLDIEKSASDADVKRAYRKAMSQNHPDKLMSQGLPEEMIKLATEKTQQIKAAYERIKAARGM